MERRERGREGWIERERGGGEGEMKRERGRCKVLHREGKCVHVHVLHARAV